MSEPASPAAPQTPTFDSLPLGAEVRKAVETLGWVHPTPVQIAVLEPASRGRNLVVQARTGTGKTGAFGLPIVDQLVKKSVPKVQALVLTPTRELALQVARELEQLAQFRELKIASIYGGAPMGKQIDALADGAQIVAGTPGRVLDHLRRGTLDPSHIRVFVLDEADEMLSMGFAKELHAIAECLPKDRQGLFFSATIPPDIERLAQAQLKNPEFITLSSDQVGALEIQHFVYMVPSDKRQALVRILEVEDPESAIVFCNTKDETERLAEALKNAGYDAEWLNGDLEQRERERIMQKTREGKCRFLVATDVAARGIDISHLTHVINADFPEAAEQYVHRTGRTGRAGRTGTAISVVTPKDIGNLYILRLTYKIRPIERVLPTAGELKTRAEADIVAMFVEAFGARQAHADDLALARRLLTHPDAEKIVAGLVRDHLGARPGDPGQLAAEARRAKNPEPIHEEAPVHVPRPHSSLPSASRPQAPPREREREREREHPPRERKERPDRAPRGQRRAPHATFATWEPPTEHDDDKPILSHDTDVPPPPGTDLPGYTESTPERRAQAARPDAARPDRDDEEDFAQIFVNVGRRENARPLDFLRMLENGGVERKDAGRIRIRDRNTFVSVRRDAIDKAVAALAGQSLGGRTIVAELAKRAVATGDEPRNLTKEPERVS